MAHTAAVRELREATEATRQMHRRAAIGALACLVETATAELARLEADTYRSTDFVSPYAAQYADAVVRMVATAELLKGVDWLERQVGEGA